MPDEATQEPSRRIRPRPIEAEMHRSYIDYAMSVIVGRALPDVRDALKPVQRRILHTMNETGASSTSQWRKAARVVGDCLGRYHPHGDTAIYDALARMVQAFSLRYPLVQGQGNWGSTEDEPAAMRYTECRLSKVAEEILQDLEKDTVDWMDNFDGTMREPVVLPSKFPNLLVNGSSGIAVGMATNIPPHNLGEVVDALVLLIGNPAAELQDLYNPEAGPIRGPDFPTRGTLYGAAGVTEAYKTGRGLISIRAAAHVEEAGHDKARIVITEIPYLVNKAALVESIALLVKSKKIEGVVDLRDESDREGMRVVLELKRDAVEDVVLNQLYHHTQMEQTFGVINLALVGGEPKVLTLKEVLQSHVDHRVMIVRRRTEFDLRKARERLHIVEGLITAVDHLDEVIRLIRRARDAAEAEAGLTSRYLLSEAQAKAILAMALRQLTGLEIEKLRAEQTGLKKNIEELEAILASRERVLDIIKTELLEMKDEYGDERRTKVEAEAFDMEIEDLIPEEHVVVPITNTGYIKRVPSQMYHTQRRGGKGVTGMETKEEDFVVNLFTASTHDYILFFSSKGQCYWLKTYRLPVGSRYAKGKPIVNLLPRLEPSERAEPRGRTRGGPDRRGRRGSHPRIRRGLREPVPPDRRPPDGADRGGRPRDAAPERGSRHLDGPCAERRGRTPDGPRERIRQADEGEGVPQDPAREPGRRDDEHEDREESRGRGPRGRGRRRAFGHHGRRQRDPVSCSGHPRDRTGRARRADPASERRGQGHRRRAARATERGSGCGRGTVSTGVA